MKRLLLIGSLFFTVIGISQEFTPVTTDTTLYGDDTDNDFYGDIPIANDNGASNSMYWEVDSVNLPAGWEFSVCDQTICYPIGTQNVQWNLPGNGGYLNMHFYPNGQAGNGLVILKVNDSPNENQIEYLTFRANAASTAGINESSLEQITLYPNPATHMLIIKGDQLRTATIFDLNGRTELTKDLNQSTSIDVSGLETGVYTIRIHTENGEHIQKLLIK